VHIFHWVHNIRRASTSYEFVMIQLWIKTPSFFLILASQCKAKTEKGKLKQKSLCRLRGCIRLQESNKFNQPKVVREFCKYWNEALTRCLYAEHVRTGEQQQIEDTNENTKSSCWLTKKAGRRGVANRGPFFLCLLVIVKSLQLSPRFMAC